MPYLNQININFLRPIPTEASPLHARHLSKPQLLILIMRVCIGVRVYYCVVLYEFGWRVCAYAECQGWLPRYASYCRLGLVATVLQEVKHFL